MTSAFNSNTKDDEKDGGEIPHPSRLTVDELSDLLFVKAQAVAKAYSKQAEADAQYKTLAGFNKTILYQCMPEAFGEKKATEESRKKSAYTHEMYIQHLEGEMEAYKKYAKAEAKLQSEKIKYEAVKSALLKKYGTAN